MKKNALILLIGTCFFLMITVQAFSSEKLLFADYTGNILSLSLRDFFIQEAHYSVIMLPEPLPSQEEIITPEYWEQLALLGNLLCIVYEKNDFVFIQLVDLHFRQEILSLVRRKENQEKVAQDVKARMRRILSLHPEIKIVFPREEKDRFLLVACDPQGKRETVLASTDLGPMERLSISPDGQLLAFTVNHGYKRAIYLFRFQDHTFQLLSPWEWIDFSPSFSEKERKIVFVSERRSKKGIFIMNLDGSVQVPFLEKDNPVDFPSFSNDGRRFVYCELLQGKWQLKIQDLLRQQEEILDFPGNVLQPTFTPDGRQIIFVGEIEGNYDLYAYSLLEGNLIRLTVDNFPKAHPTCSPDGRWIAFRGQKEGNNWDIFVLDRHKRNVMHRLTSSLAREGDPVFTPYPIY